MWRKLTMRDYPKNRGIYWVEKGDEKKLIEVRPDDDGGGHYYFGNEVEYATSYLYRRYNQYYTIPVEPPSDEEV